MRYISAPQRSHGVLASVLGVAAGVVSSAETGSDGDRETAEAGGAGSDIAGIIAHD